MFKYCRPGTRRECFVEKYCKRFTQCNCTLFESVSKSSEPLEMPDFKFNSRNLISDSVTPILFKDELVLDFIFGRSLIIFILNVELKY